MQRRSVKTGHCIAGRTVPFATSPILKRQWLKNGRLSTRTVRNSLKSARLKSRRVVKRPMLSDRQQRLRLAWCLVQRCLIWGHGVGSTGRTRAVFSSCNQWTNESLETGRYGAYPRNIQPTVLYDGCSVMIWGYISHGCKLDLITIRGNLTGDKYIRNVLQPVLVHHFDNHPQAATHVLLDDNARPYRSRVVTTYLQGEAVSSLPRSVMSPDLRPSCTGSWTYGTAITSIGSSIASGMAAATPAAYPTTDWRDETESWGRHPSIHREWR